MKVNKKQLTVQKIGFSAIYVNYENLILPNFFKKTLKKDLITSPKKKKKIISSSISHYSSKKQITLLLPCKTPDTFPKWDSADEICIYTADVYCRHPYMLLKSLKRNIQFKGTVHFLIKYTFSDRGK